jgi:hypothetical protein
MGSELLLALQAADAILLLIEKAGGSVRRFNELREQNGGAPLTVEQLESLAVTTRKRVEDL